MGFNAGGAMSGASAGAALGPWGAVAGGVIGGFFGGSDEPEMYGKDQYMADMAPYQQMVDQQIEQSQLLQDPNSWLNRQQNQGIMENSMDQMGVANIMSERQNASNPYINAGGIQNQQAQNNLLSYANQGLQQGRQNFQDNFGSGTNIYQNAMTHQGDISAGLANLSAANVGTMNEYNQAQGAQFSQGMGGLLGGIAGFGQATTDSHGNPVGVNAQQGLQTFLGMV